MARKKALIATNHAGFMWFVMLDINLLRSMGYDVMVAADNSDEGPHTVAEIEKRGARFVHVPCSSFSPLSPVNISCFTGFRSLMRRERFDAIVCHTPIVGLIIRTIAATMGRKRPKIIYMSHGFNWNRFSGWKARTLFRMAEDFGSRHCDAIITINEDDRREARTMHCRRLFKINGVGCDVARFQHDAFKRRSVRKELGVNDDDIVVLSIGRICKLKNQMVVIKAIARMPDKERCCFVVCGKEYGGSSLTDKMKAAAEVSGVRLKMLGFRNDMERIVQAADIGILPSLKEGLGIASVEMLSAGVPLVGTSVQGMREYIIDGVTGYLVDNPFDEEAFAVAIGKLADRDKRASMREACMSMAKKFDIGVSLRQRREIFEEVFS